MGFRRFVGSTRGATSIEYAVIATLVSLLIIGGVTTIGTKLSQKYVTMSRNLT